jgi:type VI secretion system protein ImpF
MPRPGAYQGLTPSLLDRLVDPESEGTAGRYGYSVEQMVRAVQRDLEDLLNTRQVPHDVPRELREARRSVLFYGLPDVSAMKAATYQQREDVGRVIETMVSLFEPRLQKVRATMLDQDDGVETRVRFRIDARLRVDPAPEVAFDTILELTTGHYSVKSAAV